uniref:Lariat debranching enzyme A n=1 Tax=Lygus hesperus TaxID=30085 RepID=A0A146KN02_LYGHE
MKVAVEGCAHGELEKIYECIAALSQMSNSKIDLLICCGDFQATRNLDDLDTMAVPQKFRQMCSFYKYYTGELVAPVLTIFVGGNHEASNYLQELPYGGWVAPNIYYLGYSGVVNIAGVRIAGVSGIFKGGDHHRGRFERMPFSESTKRSVYHVRNLDIYRLRQIESPVDIVISHDWPQGVYNFGDKNSLIKMKPFFKDEIDAEKLGSPVNSELLFKLKPKYWFAAHLHVKFAALIPHKDEGGNVTEVTKFLALDKCLPKRKFLQVVDIEHDPSRPLELEYDLEWLAILHYTNHLISVDSGMNYLPSASSGNQERWIFTPTEDEKEFILEKMDNNLNVPLNFKTTAPGYRPDSSQTPGTPTKFRRPPTLNPQTIEFCKKLGIDDPVALLLGKQDPGRTPERAGCPADTSDPNLSFVDSEVSGFYSGSDENEKSENNESDKEGIAESSPSSRRSALQLPAPKFESSSPVIELEESPPAPELEDHPLFVIDEGPKRGVDESTPLQDEGPKRGVDESTPLQGKKKFKRRNQSLYANNDED